jgi:hypothetical protein
MSSASNPVSPASPHATMSPLGRIATGAMTVPSRRREPRLVGSEGVLRPLGHLGPEPAR